MNPADRLLASLAAAFAPGRAAALLARLDTPDAPRARAHAERLAQTPRSERLAALAAALAAAHHAAIRASPGRERPRVARILEILRSGERAPAVAPALERICRERIGP